MEHSIKIGNHYYDVNCVHFSLEWEQDTGYMRELSCLSRFPNLKSVSFACSNLNDEGVAHVSDCREIEILNLQETEITNEGITYLKKLKKLKYLRLKENYQLTNACISALIAVEQLEDLQIHGTSVTEEGLSKLVVLKNLKDLTIDVRENNYTFEGLLKISKEIPDCHILAKGDGMFYKGEFNGEWGHPINR